MNHINAGKMPGINSKDDLYFGSNVMKMTGSMIFATDTELWCGRTSPSKSPKLNAVVRG